MKAIETTATIDESGKFILDKSLGQHKPQQVRVIVLFADEDDGETPTEVLLEGICQGLHEALTGKTIPLSKMWEGIDGE